MVFACIAWVWIPRGLSLTMTEAASLDAPAVPPRERWVRLSLPPPPSFTFIFFFLLCLFGLLPGRALALETESSVKSLALPEPRFPFLGCAVLQGPL